MTSHHDKGNSDMLKSVNSWGLNHALQKMENKKLQHDHIPSSPCSKDSQKSTMLYQEISVVHQIQPAILHGPRTLILD